MAAKQPAAGAPSGGPVFRAALLSDDTDGVYTFTGVDIGTASADRTVIVAVAFFHTGDRTIDTTINASAATEDYEYGGALSNRHNIAFSHLQVASGTTATIEITSFTLNPGVLGIYVWTVEGAVTATQTQGTYAVDDPSMSVTVPSGGFALAASTTKEFGAWVWSGATEEDSLLGVQASDSSAATITSTGTVTADSGSGSTTGLVTVAYSIA